MNRKVFLIAIVGLFCLANVTRWGFRSKFAGPRFAAESAAHYRYVEMAAKGRAIPALDAKAQWPEGLRVYRETSVGMEYLYGLAYRLIPGHKPDLAKFIHFFTPFLFSLSIFPLAFLSAGLWRSNAAGVLTAVLFAVCLPLVGRSNGSELIRENITFPLMIFHIYFFLKACSVDGWRWPVLSGVFLFLALSTWQGTQFYLVPLLLFLLVRKLMDISPSGEGLAVRVLTPFIVSAGLFVPFLRESNFLVSIAIGFLVAWLAVDLLSLAIRGGGAAVSGGTRGKTAAKRRFLGIAVASATFACIIMAGVLLKGHFVSYSHLFRLILYKLKYVHKPTDPGLLPFDVRAFWVGPFHSPDLRHFFVFALPLILLLPDPMTRLVRRMRGGDFQALFNITFLAIFFVLFLMMQRLLPLFGFFAVIAAGGNVAGLGTEERRLNALSPAILLTVFVLIISLLQDFAWESPADLWRRASKVLRIPSREKFAVFPLGVDVEGSLLSWIRRNTADEDVVMSIHYLSPQVLTYTGRPTNLNDFFESTRQRRKAEKFLKLLYSSEGSLLRFCEEQESRYLLVSIAAGCDPTRDSPLYQAGFTNMPTGCAAYRLLFEPEKLEGFELVFENEMYRLFRVGGKGTGLNWPRSPLFYEKELLWRFDGDIRSFYNSVMHVYSLTARALSLIGEGREGEAEAILTRALRVFYFYPAWRALNELYTKQGRLIERETLCGFAYRHDPNRSDVCIELARSRIDLGKGEGVKRILDRCYSLHTSEHQREVMNRLLLRLERISDVRVND